MVHHIGLYKLKPDVTAEETEEMMMRARMQLLKIDEVLSIKCGRRINPKIQWPFFYRDRFRVDGQAGDFSGRPDLHQICRGSNQTQDDGMPRARLRDGSRQGHLVKLRQESKRWLGSEFRRKRSEAGLFPACS